MSKKQTYVKKDPISHILDRPDMYVGSIRSRNIEEFAVVNEDFKIEKKTVNVSPAILRIFIEPLSNIIDNVARSKINKSKLSKIDISINEETGETSLWNDGEVIPIELHEKEKCYNHSMIFGQLLTSSNYDDKQDREDISGRNGLGVKLTCVFSKEFKVEAGDSESKKTFLQIWKNNMRESSEPEVNILKTVKPYTKITFLPDFKHFGLDGYTKDILSLYYRFVVDCAMITRIPVFLNGKQIPVENLIDYAKLYGNFLNKSEKDDEQPDDEQKDDEVKQKSSRSKSTKSETLYIKTKDCEVFLAPSDGEFQTISFANGVYTPLGGTHVESWSEAIFRPIVEKLNKGGKTNKPQFNISEIKKYFRLFVIATVKKPEFDSQSKTKLEAPEIIPEVKKTHITSLCKWNFMNILEELLRLKEMSILKKSERKKRGYEKVEGLDPANNEGTSKSNDCTLILVEGLSAKTYASAGIEKGAFGKKGRDWFGIYALRGKVLNCRNASPLTISKNNVVTDIIKALGIQYDLDYSNEENYKKLRYGKVMIVTDADTDGIHISGLIQNMFHSLFPSLIKRTPPFIISMQTPIVRVYLGKTDRLFYDENEYRKYVKQNENKKIDKKYYKGLGSSNTQDVLETFGQKLIEYKEDEKTTDNMNKAFYTKYANARKEWLEKYDSDFTVLKWNGDKEECLSVSFSDYINGELIKFSIEDCRRSIPNLMDGLKEGHRKILYVAFLRNLKHSGKVIKVAQFAGSVSEKAGYHHGEQNLESTITGMADAYVGSNNIPLLFRDGQFGSRSEGGKDAAAGRYIWTKLEEITRFIFREEDDCLLDYIDDDGDKIEPKFYVPIIPMILVNGSIGIGTGWSCNIPCYNPIDLIDCIKAWLDNNNNIYLNDQNEDIKISVLPEIKPWYRGHKGEMVVKDRNTFLSHGVIEKDNKNNAIITELPVGLWTSVFVDHLESLKEEKKISTYKNYSSPTDISFTIKQCDDGIECDLKNLGLIKSFKTTNMVLFTENFKLKKYDCVENIIDNFCKVRYEYYVKRKKVQLSILESDIKLLSNKKRFLSEIRDGDLKLFEEVSAKKQSRKTIDLVQELTMKGYDKKNDKKDIEEESKNEEELNQNHGYEYLLRLQINSITAEKINKLENDINVKKQEYYKLTKISEKQLWINDLEEFKNVYLKWLPKINNEGTNKKNKKK